MLHGAGRTKRGRMDTTTRAAVTGLVERLGTQRKASSYLGESTGVISDIVLGKSNHVSYVTEQRVRAALGLAPVPRRVEVECCPDCGAVHTGRCHGRAVRVQAVRVRVVSRVVDMSLAQLRAAIRGRYDY